MLADGLVKGVATSSLLGRTLSFLYSGGVPVPVDPFIYFVSIHFGNL